MAAARRLACQFGSDLLVVDPNSLQELQPQEAKQGLTESHLAGGGLLELVLHDRQFLVVCIRQASHVSLVLVLECPGSGLLAGLGSLQLLRKILHLPRQRLLVSALSHYKETQDKCTCC